MFGIGTTENDAIELLKSDHKEVDQLFDDYEARKEEGKGSGKAIIAQQIYKSLTVHATIEEEIFYPAVRKRVKEAADLIDEAAVEHQTLKDLIARWEAAPINDPLREAGMKVLSEYVKRHVKEEERELFPKVRASDLDLAALGKELRLRRAELEGKRNWFSPSETGATAARNDVTIENSARYAAGNVVACKRLPFPTLRTRRSRMKLNAAKLHFSSVTSRPYARVDLPSASGYNCWRDDARLANQTPRQSRHLLAWTEDSPACTSSPPPTSLRSSRSLLHNEISWTLHYRWHTSDGGIGVRSKSPEARLS